jgi:hypothetical protein
VEYEGNLKYHPLHKFLLVKYDDRDNAIMANHVFHQLCELDERDRKLGRDPQWRDIVALADEVKANEDNPRFSYQSQT